MKSTLVHSGLLMLTLFSMALLSTACASNRQVQCAGDTALLTVMDFPQANEIKSGRIISPLPDGTIYSAGRSFYLGTGVAIHDVYPFSSSKGARQEFELQHKSPVFSGTYGDWRTPVELEGRLSSATQASAACGTENKIPMCRAIAQYENYYVLFNIHDTCLSG